MKFSCKDAAALGFRLLGAVSWIYLGVYRLLKGPVKNIIVAKMADTLTLSLLLSNFFRGFVYLTAAGFIWCLCYMAKGYFTRK